jgi:hypothetical protein
MLVQLQCLSFTLTTPTPTCVFNHLIYFLLDSFMFEKVVDPNLLDQTPRLRLYILDLLYFIFSAS